MNAYNYDEQRWITGEEAVALRRAQITKELELLTGPRGAAYATFLQSKRAELIARGRAALAALANVK